MSNRNEALIRAAYAAYLRGEIAALLELVHPDLEWTYLDPSLADPPLQTCHGRGELEAALRRRAEQGLESELEEVRANGDRVVVGVHTPGLDATRARHANDLTATTTCSPSTTAASPRSAPAATVLKP